MLRRCALRLCLTVVVLAAGVTAAAAQPDKRVLLLFDEDHSLPGLTVLKQSFRSTLSGEMGPDIEFFIESMNASQFPDERYSGLLSEYYRGKYTGKRLDLIVSVMGPALTFLVEHAERTFPGVPFVFFGADAADLRRHTLPSQGTGILLKREYAPTLDIVLRLLPSTRRVIVAGGTSTFDRHLQTDARREFDRFAGKVDVEYKTDLPISDLLEAVSRLPPGSVVLYLTMFRDGAGQTFVPHAVAGRIATASAVPVFIFVDQYLGTGVVGGHLYSLEQHGALAAQIAARVLRGEAPASVPVREIATGVPMFDARQLARWRIDERLLPTGSAVRFREVTLWERYRPYVVALALLTVAQSMLIGGLIVQRRRRQRAERNLQVSFTQIRDLSRRVMTAQEEERARLARELHDDLSQQLAVLNVDLHLLRRSVDGEAAAALTESVSRAERIARTVHDLSHQLHPSRLRLAGLTGALESLRAELARPHLSLTFTYEGVPQRLPPELTLSLFRVAQEALQNAIKHAGARTIALQLRGDKGELTLTVTDDGKGFDVAAAQSRGGIGLISMRERIETVGGQCEIRSIQGRGTTVVARVPVSVESQENYSAV